MRYFFYSFIFLSFFSFAEIVFPSFPKTEAEIESLGKTAHELLEKSYDQVAATSLNELSFENTFKKLDIADSEFAAITSRISVLSSLSTDAKLRKKASDVNANLSAFASNLNLRTDIFQVLKSLSEKPEFQKLNSNDQRVASLYLRNFRKSGAEQSTEKRKEIEKIQNQISSLTSEFSQALSSAGTKTTSFSFEETSKLPLFVLKMMEKFKTVKDFQIPNGNQNLQIAIENNSDDALLREKVWQIRQSFAKSETLSLATKVINSRKALAQALGYNTYADYQVDGRMAQKTENIYKLYNELLPKLDKLKEAQKQRLLEFKNNLLKNSKPENKILYPWDISFLEQKIKEQDYNIDPESLRAYFPLKKVTAGTFTVYGKIFGVSFKKYTGNFDKWIDSVDLYKVIDNQSGQTLGLVYLDLIARPELGKRNGAWMGGIIPHQTIGTKVIRPTVQVVTNFRPPLKGASDTYLSFEEMTTFFHEFGHAVHNIFSDVPHYSLSQDSVAWDFIETPSQMMEEFLEDYKIIAQLSLKEETQEPLPKDIFEKVIASSKITSGYHWARQVALGKMDLSYYDRQVELPDLNDQMVSDMSDAALSNYWLPVPENTAMVTRFQHIISGGYSAGYYGYLWSKIVAADCAEQFRSSPDGFLNPLVGKKWRDQVLARENQAEASVLVRDFLGRNYNSEAFVKTLNRY
jgi:Zn-dependent oligopeptidase